MSPMKTLAALVLLATLLGGCDSRDGQHSSGDDWTKSPGRTTCREWRNAMSENQRISVTYAMLVGMWDLDGRGDPGSSDIEDMEAGITKACTVPSAKVSKIAATLYALANP